MTNLFAGIPAELPRELVEVLQQNELVRIERIVSQGHASPPDYWYDQAEHEWVTVLQGQARLSFADGVDLLLNPGDHVWIAAHRRHRVVWTTAEQPTIWLAVFVLAHRANN